MSHVVEMEGIRFKNLKALRLAANEFGCELVEGQTTYKQYWTGTPAHKIRADYIPKGFTAEEIGQCEHAIRVKNGTDQTYELGVVKAKDGNGYILMTDWFQGGYGLEAAVGPQGKWLRQAYTAHTGAIKLRSQGMRVTTVKRADNQILVRGVMG